MNKFEAVGSEKMKIMAGIINTMKAKKIVANKQIAFFI